VRAEGRQIYLIVINGRSPAAALFKEKDHEGAVTEGVGESQVTHPMIVCTHIDMTERYVHAKRFWFKDKDALPRSVYLPHDSIVGIQCFHVDDDARELSYKQKAGWPKDPRRSFAWAQ